MKFLKTQFLFYSIFIVLLFANSCKSESDKIAERNAIIDSTLTNFQKIYYQNQLDSVFAKNNFNGSIAVFADSTEIYEKENGFENFKTKEKLDPNSVFAIGSLSKQFTAVLILLQEEAGKLKTSDKVSKYLTEFQNPAYEDITIHQLLNHTSGISDFGNGLISKPGKEFNYSNKGYRFLGDIIAKVSGKSYDVILQTLFVKAGMKDSSTPILFKENNFASAYLGTSSHPSIIENMPKRLSDDEISVPAGGILSTIPDLNRWNNALYNGQILKPESLRKFTENSSARNHPILGKVGYGYGIMMSLDHPKSYFHTGYVKGSPSLNIYYPKTRTSVIILSNIADESKGKKAIFVPHNEVKNTTDAIENTIEELKKKMIKKIED